MGPQLLVDTSSLINRLDTPIARGSAPASERTGQVKALVTGALLFLPFLAAYVALSSRQ
ncbi:hypothetical protein [Paraburkholderia unamae]|uniref:Uncharacterized protein n=1 Tax=Paraburkholderia unamae TaxID=219649 RepID=A0ABX5KEU9_9BURK|nr:hypothetical protein [Paraburkholderia unamae]PVX76383.1 hypothetical protein C7402_116168 [Paraburkholderia unamae]